MEYSERMRIVADENIPFVKEAFADLGSVVTMPGREIARSALAEADILVVRSVTKVNAELLTGTPVKFVGTATIGTDHIDMRYCADNAIGFAFAPGSNADSVAQYVISAIVLLAQRRKLTLADCTLGIIGVGNIGTRVHRLAEALGMSCLLNDPPKQRLTGSSIYVDRDTLLAASDIVTVHVPLSRVGDDATSGLANDGFFLRMRENAIFINTSRGPVMSERSLLSHRSRLSGIVLDVWENEPVIDPAMIAAADIATPHIAGYSHDGKVRGTSMLHDAACAFFFKERIWRAQRVLDCEQPIVIDCRGSESPLLDALMASCPLLRDDTALRACIGMKADERGRVFDSLRKKYPKRLEFGHFRVACDDHMQVEALEKLGFKRVPEILADLRGV
jgi:erythronate-4-phosphate dehydrogenase